MSEENWRATITDHAPCGLTAAEFFQKFGHIGAGWGNILFQNGYTDFRRSEISLRTRLTRKIFLNIPIVTSPMDTVTKARMAVAASDAGGAGIIHVNLQPTQAAREVSKVKRGGLITDPLALAPTARLEEVELVRSQYSHIPVTEDGKPDGKLVGMISNRFRPGPQHEIVRECMEEPVAVYEKDILRINGTVQIDEAFSLMDVNYTDVLAVVTEYGRLVGIVVRSDLRGIKGGSRMATLDAQGRWIVGAAVTTDPADYERRVPLLLENGADVLCIDTAHGDSVFVVEALSWIKSWIEKHELHTEVIAGNISTGAAARRLIDAGADALRVGNGTGLICTTHRVTRTGASPVVGLYRVAQVAAQYDIPVIADGGIQESGDVVAALGLGASCVMAGRYVVGVWESAAPIKTAQVEGRTVRYKEYRGMASPSAIAERVVVRYDGQERLAQKAEGREIQISLLNKSFAEHMEEEMAGVVAGFNNIGVRSIPELQQKVRRGEILMEYIPSQSR